MRVAGTGFLVCVLVAGGLRAQSANNAQQVVNTMLTHENDAGEHRNRYMYLSLERSDRTGGHLWKERVVETAMGKVRLLLEEDGQPLSKERQAAERVRLADIAAHPEALQRREQVRKSDEEHADQMLELLRKAFKFEGPHVEGGDLRIAYQPDPAYQPQTLEERVLHAMSGSILIDERTMQLHKIEGSIPVDVSLGYGLLGTIHAGSHFSTTHEMQPGNEWKTSVVETAINGKALFFKAIGRNEHRLHSEFKQLPSDITVAQAVQMLER